MPRRSALAPLVALVLLVPAVGHGFDITTCNQIIHGGETGVLQNDLVCSIPVNGCFACGSGPCFPTGALCSNNGDCEAEESCHTLPIIGIDRHGTLDLNGHSITAPGQFGVNCRVQGPCTVKSSVGRGEITGSVIAIAMATGKLTVSDVDLHDNTVGGIYSALLHTRATVTNVTANDNGGIGIRVQHLHAHGVTANGNGQYGIEVDGKLTGVDVTANDNAWTGITVTKSAKVDGLTATGNGTPYEDSAIGGGFQVFRGPIFLTNSTVTGNVYYPLGEPGQPLDLISSGRPKLKNTTCGYSARFDNTDNSIGSTWGVCGSD